MYQPPQQPYTYYPPPPPGPPPKTNRRLWLIIGIIIGMLILCSAIGNAISKSSPAPSTDTVVATDTPIATDTPVPTDTPAPTSPPASWTTTHSFKGNGDKTTETFQTSGDWKLVWTAQASSGYEAFFGASVYGTDGQMVDSGADATIPAGKKMTDSTEEHTGAGSFYIKVYAGVPWTISIVELK